MDMWLRAAISIILLGSCFISPSSGITRQSKIVLENNGYKNLIIAIDKNVPEDANLIQGVKNTFIHASKVLYRATRRRAYFHSITILLPSTWADNHAYGSPSEDVTYHNADIVIFNPVRRKKRAMYTRRYSGCGQPGIHIQLVAPMFTDVNAVDVYGPIDKMIVHEWGHFRWGLFDEYAKPGDAQYYFSPSTGQLEGIRCIFNMRGLSKRTGPNGTTLFCRPTDVNPETLEYPDGCEYVPYPARANKNVNASFMFHQALDNIVDFCDEGNHGPHTEHNYEAPSLQNRKCGHRSTWEVMEMTDDFRNNLNPPRDIPEKDLSPAFFVVKPNKSKRTRRSEFENKKNDHELADWIFVKNDKARIEIPTMFVRMHRRTSDSESIYIQSHIDYNGNVTQNAVIFADVRCGLDPVVGLSINATVVLPNMEQQIISLLDNGVGSDIEENDGVYSRSFSNFSQSGIYAIRLQVNNDRSKAATRLHYIDENNHRTGSMGKTKHEHIPLAVPLQFEMNLGRLYIPKVNMQQNFLPPSRISDLRLVGVSSSKKTVTLSWSAPGDDFDHGKAFRYEIRVSTSVRHLLDRFDQAQMIREYQMDKPLTPKTFGERENVVIDMSEISTQGGYAFAIIGVDGRGNRGDMSNIVTAGFFQSNALSNTTK